MSFNLKWTAIGGDILLEIPRNHLVRFMVQISAMNRILTGLANFINTVVISFISFGGCIGEVCSCQE